MPSARRRHVPPAFASLTPRAETVFVSLPLSIQPWCHLARRKPRRTSGPALPRPCLLACPGRNGEAVRYGTVG